MITEHAMIEIAPGKEGSFIAAFESARRHLDGSPGCQSARLLRGVESPSIFLLLVSWETLEDHVVTFRSSPAFSAWRDEVGPYFASGPEVVHFASLRG